mgnify:CR=1 FL=1
MAENKKVMEEEAVDTKETKATRRSSDLEQTCEETKDTKETAAEETKETAAEEKDTKKEEKSEKKGAFGKKKKDKKDEQIEELNDKLKRQMAEFDNFRKRTEKEKTQMYDMGAKSIIEKILPVIDNFERGLQGVPEEEKDAPFVKGVEMVYKQMLTAFDEMGVKPIDAVGKEFDPNLHNAVMAVDDDSLESGTVAEEMQKGYMYKESVVRHSMVKVVN